jgi:hypothetical protein
MVSGMSDKAFPQRRATRACPLWLLRLASATIAFILGLPVAQAQYAETAVPLPNNPQNPTYYKDGNGPLVSTFERWLPSNNYGSTTCRAPKGVDAISRYTDPLKCIPLGSVGANGGSYLVLNGFERLRSENYQHSGLGVASSTNAAGVPSSSPLAVGGNQSERWMTHTILGGDLHVIDYFRAFAQLDNATQSGREIVRPSPTANNRNDLALLALFGEARFNVNQTSLDIPFLHNTIFGLRVGRENIGFGSDRFWFAPSFGVNIAGPAFDGFHAFADSGPTRLDLFAFNFVNEINAGESSVLEDRDNARQHVWGAHLSHDLPIFTMLGMQGTTGIDGFYYGYSNSAAQYTNQAFLKSPSSLAIAAGGASFITAHDYRHEIGLRYYGALGPFDFDYSGVIQRGSFGSYDVDAWAFHTSTGYHPPLPWHPWVGVWFDGASGGVSSASKGGSNTIMTFQPIRQNAYSISTIAVSQALSNVIVFSPRLVLNPEFDVGPLQVRHMRVDFSNNFYFRQNQNDAVYGGTYFGNQTLGGANPYQITAVKRGQYIGYKPNVRLSWTFVPHITYSLDWAFEFVGPALKAAGGKDTLYVRNQIIFDF